jgi:hypothetical protein
MRSAASSGEDVAPRSMREIIQKKFLDEVIGAAGISSPNQSYLDFLKYSF